MNSKFKITIPKPCNENWNKMSPKEKGRFCSSCAKTVVDFTKKSTKDIQSYLVENKNEQVCGHFYKKQLDSIIIEIPQITFQQQLSFQKLFVLALFFVMGTTLFSCQYSDGKKQKIENVILQDSIEKIDSVIEPKLLKPILDTIIINKDTLFYERGKNIPLTKSTKNKTQQTLGIFICETASKKDSILDLTTTGDIEEITIDGGIDFTEVGEVAFEEEVTLGFITIENPPRFKESLNLSKVMAKKDFDKRIKQFVKNNFNEKLTTSLDLKSGKYRIQAQFEIDTLGNINDIKVRAPHPKLEKETRKTLKKLPKFIPGKHRNKKVKTLYSLPIAFVVE